MGVRRERPGFVAGALITLATWIAPGMALAQLVPPDPATSFTAAVNAAWLGRLPFSDRADFEAASRGLVARVAGPVTGPQGRPTRAAFPAQRR